MNYELKLASQWMKLNKLSLNKDKTKPILFHSSYKAMNTNLLSIKLEKSKLTPVDHVKYLGMYLDSHLSWEYHKPIMQKIKPSKWYSCQITS